MMNLRLFSILLVAYCLISVQCLAYLGPSGLTYDRVPAAEKQVAKQVEKSFDPELKSCEVVLDIGQPNPNFKHNTIYTKIIPVETEMRAQCALGSCNLHAWSAILEQSYQERTGQKLNLSVDYLAAKQIIARSLELLNQNTKDLSEIGLGESAVTSRQAIVMHGLVPQSAWTPKADFKGGAMTLGFRFQAYIRHVLAAAKAQLVAAKTPEKQAAIREKARAQVEAIMASVVGEFPETFNFQGKTYTPQQFASEHFPELRAKIHTLAYHADGETDYIDKGAAPRIAKRDESLNNESDTISSIENFEEILKGVIDQNVGVYLSFITSKEFINYETGVMSLQAFILPPGFQLLPRAQRGQFNLAGGHAVQVVGYEQDPKTGAILKWKIKNSWGANIGDGGYFHMYQDFFREFVNRFSFLETK